MKNDKQKGSGFDCPTIGYSHSKGSVVRQRKDGTSYVVQPSQQSVRKYKKEFDYSYTLGTELTLQLLISQPLSVEKVFVHSKQNDNEIYRRIVSLCEKNYIEIIKNDKIFNILSDKENCYIIGIFSKYYHDIEPQANHLVLVNPSDRGNLGTIIRTAIGFGVTNLAIITPCVDVFDPKVIRASMGAFFQMNIQLFDSFEQYQEVADKRNIYTFMLDGAKRIDQIEIPDKYSIVFGNEARGLDPIYQQYGQSILIKHLNTIDSLNLCNAVSIGLYQFNKDKM